MPALDGLRLVAAVAIYFFHLFQAHSAGVMRFEVIEHFPSSLQHLLSRGHVATGLFFVLSGFLLTYVYSDHGGKLKTSVGRFWILRWISLYPIYFLSLLLIAPLPALLPITGREDSLTGILQGIGTSLTLTQAWFPSLALFWNPPAWALSATVAFYFLFPFTLVLLRNATQRSLSSLLVALPAIGLTPALLYLVIDPEGNALTATTTTIGGNWLAALRFHPITWLASFLSGIVLAKLFVLAESERIQNGFTQGLFIQPNGHRVSIDLVDIGKPRTKQLPSWLRPIKGADVAVIALLMTLACPSLVPYVLLRHGLFLPVHIYLVWELAHGRGIVSKILSTASLRRWSKASFGIFALQMPIGVWFAYLVIQRRSGTAVELMGMIVATLIGSYVISRLLENSITRPLREWMSRSEHQKVSTHSATPLSRSA